MTENEIYATPNGPIPGKPHWDYNGPNYPPKGARLNLDGTWELK